LKKKQPNNQRITALYARLSRDDEKEGKESSLLRRWWLLITV